MYSTVSQDPSTGISMYSTSIVSHFALVSNHCTSCSKQVEPEQTVNSICQIISIVCSFEWCSQRESNSQLRFTKPLLYRLTIGALNLERARRIELLSSDWKSVIIPLYDTRVLAEAQGFEPWRRFSVCSFSRRVLSTTQPRFLLNIYFLKLNV